VNVIIAWEKTKKTMKKYQKEKKTMRERKVEIGRDDVLMRHTMRILLKRIQTMTSCRCQEN
jgi:hypothetical protein